MTRLLEHFVPNTEFNLTTLRALASNLDGTKAEEGLSPAGNGLLGLSPASSSLVSPGKIQEEDMEAGEIDELHRQMGWLRLDSNGIYSTATVMKKNVSDELLLTCPRTRWPEFNLLLPRRRSLPNDSPTNALPISRGPSPALGSSPPSPSSARLRRSPKVAQADKPPPTGPLRRVRIALLPRHPVRVLVLLRGAAPRCAGQDIRGRRWRGHPGAFVRPLLHFCNHERESG